MTSAQKNVFAVPELAWRGAEFASRLNSGPERFSVATMNSPSGWREPGQRPELEELSVVLPIRKVRK